MTLESDFRENIFEIALSRLSEKEQKAMLAYQEKTLEIQRQGVEDSTVALESVLKQVRGARKALRHYDKEVGKLMKTRGIVEEGEAVG